MSSGAPTANGPAIGSASAATVRTAQNPSLSTSSSTDEHPQLPYPEHRTNGPPPSDRRQQEAGRKPGTVHIRIVKIRQKYPAAYATSQAPSTSLRSYTGTAGKQNINRYEALTRFAAGHPWLPSPQTDKLPARKPKCGRVRRAHASSAVSWRDRACRPKPPEPDRNEYPISETSLCTRRLRTDKGTFKKSVTQQ